MYNLYIFNDFDYFNIKENLDDCNIINFLFNQMKTNLMTVDWSETEP